MVKRSVKCLRHVLLMLMLFNLAADAAFSEDWPTYRHDQRRSGVSSEEIPVGNLSQAWQWQSTLPPTSAWPDAARWDAYAQVEGMRSMRDYDSAFQPVVYEGKLLLGSNADDTLYCFDLAAGTPLWKFTTGGPIRVAPTIVNGIAYLGSDDGCAYAVKIRDGSLLWKRQLVDAELFINDGRLCSFQPIRTGLLFDESTATLIAGVGLFPWHASSIFALQSESGEIEWQQQLGTGWTIEGPMLLGEQYVVSPQGRAPPQLFARANGQPAGALGGGGGSFALLTEQGEVLHGPGNKGGWLTASRADSREQFMSFENGISLVVHGTTAFVLDSNSLTAVDRTSQQPIWKVALRAGEELILAGSTLFAGGDGYVTAISAKDGTLLWASPILGRGRGLVAAQGHLVVSSDLGQLTVFRGESAISSADEKSWLELTAYQAMPVSVEAPAKTAPRPAQTWPAEFDLIERWTFQDHTLQANSEPRSIESDIPTGHSIVVPAHSRFFQFGDNQALVLEETVDAQVAKDFREVEYPQESLTAIATVRIDQAQPWGGLMSISQDNGEYERGWNLGFQNRKFGFAVKAESGDPGLSWALSKNDFQAGQWYQVVGTYDGSKTRLYVNGELSAEHENQKGPLAYPDQAAFQLASYRDSDEHFYSRGRLHGLALGKRALEAEEVRRLYELTCEDLGEEFQRQQQPAVVREHDAPIQGVDQFALRGFQMQFVAPRTAQVQWETAQPEICRLQILSGTAQVKEVADAADVAPRPTDQHRWLIEDVNQREVIRFCIEKQDGSDWLRSAEYQCDGHFDYTRPTLVAPETDWEYSHASSFLQALPYRNPRGLALLVQDNAETQIAEAMCLESGLDVIVLVDNDELFRQLTTKLSERKLYGRPISVRLLADSARIPDNCLNLVWFNFENKASVERSPDPISAAFSSLERCIAPEGFVICERDLPLDMQSHAQGYQELKVELASKPSFVAYRKPRAAGSQGWTHMYGLADNTAFAGETLSGATSADQMQVVWAGRPGPRYQSDRGNRKPSPLAASGRLYLQGHYRLIAMDAHNGSILWAKELPKMVRFNIPRDCSNWCCDTEFLYVAVEDACLKIDGATGEQVTEFTALQEHDRELNWGFVSRQGDLLVGSSVARNTSYTEYWGKEFWYDAKDGETAKKVASDVLFAMDSETGAERWRYNSGLVVNPTIAISDGRIVFTECRSAKLRGEASRRLDGPELWDNLFIVALDLQSGRKLWETQAKPMPGVAAMYGVSTQDQYLLQTSTGGEFALYSLALDTGEMQWRGKYGWEADHHGKHLSRPAVVGEKIYLRPLTLDRTSGEVLSKSFPVGHQCGTYTCTSNALFLRAGNLAMWDGISAAATRWDRLRPDCWISTIPAEGMLLAPEGGGGCSCGGWIETSVGFGTRMNP